MLKSERIYENFRTKMSLFFQTFISTFLLRERSTDFAVFKQIFAFNDNLHPTDTIESRPGNHFFVSEEK